MAKSAILNVLEETIGRYVLGLDAQSLNVAVWAGKISLQSLELDTNAVNLELARRAAEAPRFAIPFRVVEGRFEKLRVDVPWARITSKSVVLRAEGLDVVIEPYDHLSQNNGGGGNSGESSGSGGGSKKKSKKYSSESVHENKLNDERLQSILLAEEGRQRMSAFQNLDDYDDDDEELLEQFGPGPDKSNQRRTASSTTFKARLVRRIIENLQLDIEDIHFSVKGAGCNIGASVDKFSIFTTDCDGNKSFIDRATRTKNVNKSFLYKALQLDGLAVFCDEDEYKYKATSTPSPPVRVPAPSRQTIEGRGQGQGRNQSSSKTQNQKTCQYILSPLSFRAQLRQSDCLQCIDFPKYLLSAELPTVSFRLTRTQLELVHTIKNEIQAKQHVARPLFPEYRPDDSQPITRKNAKEWWKYAVRSIGRISRRRSWTEFYIAFQKRKRYIQLYKRLIYGEDKECTWLNPLGIAQRAELGDIENDRSISTEGIMAWRNVAEAQVDLEFQKFAEREEVKRTRQMAKTPKKRGALRSLLFGSSGKDIIDGEHHDGSISNMDVDLDDEPPITLSIEERRELDSLALESAAGGAATLSSDSMLCDISFELGSFTVDLVTFAAAPLVSMEMGTVISHFKANADGSFMSTFSLSSFDVHDRITKGSIFPVVIRSLQSSEQDSELYTFEDAMDFSLCRAGNGDQRLEAKMVSFEIVASDSLIKEVKKFLNLAHIQVGNVQSNSHSQSTSRSNPLLQYSVSGSTDMFYDANDAIGASTMMASTMMPSPGAILSDLDNLGRHIDVNTNTNTVPNSTQAKNPQNGPRVSDKLSAAFADAWKSKLEKETVWSVKLDLHAPILVLPKSCTDPLATTLVVDLGTFHFEYGTKGATPEVENWFSSSSSRNQNHNHNNYHDIKIDHCSLEMEHFSLIVAQAGYKDWLQARNTGQVSHTSSESVIEPVTLKLNVGLENGGKSRKCLFGVMEQISLSISHSQIVKIVSLASFWEGVVESLSSDNDVKEGIGIIEEAEEPNDNDLLSKSTFERSDSLRSDVESLRTKEDVLDLVHFSVVLEEFKAKIVNNKDECVEAHLLTATVASTKCSDGSSTMHLQMGHFWILDYLKGDYPRKQRLVAHSLLPSPATTYAKGRKYNIIDSFRDKVSNKKNTSINSLADIKITKSVLVNGESSVLSKIPFEVTDNEVDTTMIDAKFNALYVHWNPYSIRDLLVFQKDLASLLEEVKSIQVRRRPYRQEVIENNEEGPAMKSMLILNAKMKAFEVFLNSAKDDLPLFHLTMSNTNVNIHKFATEDENMVASVAIGDLRLEVPKTKKFRSEYCTILGLSPNHSSSLINLQFGKGPLVLRHCTLNGFDPAISEMFMMVNLSPMRFVHAHATVFTLAEYVTEGVLGAIADKIAESAAQAARELSQTETAAQKVFFVNAERLDFVLPESVYSENNFILQAGGLDVKFISFPQPGKGKAKVNLREVTMKCNRGDSVIENPIIMHVILDLAPLSAPTPDDMATIIDIDISRVAFILSRDHYAQIMRTLDCNISEANSFLREEGDSCIQSLGSTDDADYKGFEHLTHGGVEEVIIKKRMYMTFKFEAICLELYGLGLSDPLIAIAAVKSDVLLRLIPDTNTTEVNATLLDLFVEDRRAVSFDRQFTKLIQQVNNIDDEHDVFSVSYRASKSTNTTELDISVGSPQVIFIPDAVSDALSFFKASEGPPSTVEVGLPNDAIAGIQVLGEQGSLQASASSLKTVNFSIKTEDCRFILIDMGAMQSHESAQGGKKGIETIVLKGKTSATAKSTSDVFDQSIAELDCQFHADEFEVYAAQGHQLKEAVQILNPTKISCFLTTKRKGDQTHTELAFVSLMDFDIIVSMRQYALIQAIAESVSDNLKREQQDDEDSASLENSLTANETEKIHQLMRELEKNDDESSNGIELVIGKEASTVASLSSHGTSRKVKERITKIKMTLPNTNITVVNDLQGVDEAIFKITISNFINQTEICLPTKKSELLFHCHTYMLIHADYFNAYSIKWEKLLLKPWELDLKTVRGKKKNSRRMTTTIDLESHPCQISFSEQFIISLKSASAMWNVYSDTYKKAMSIIDNAMGDKTLIDRRSITEKKSMANRAARSLTTTQPYGVCNRSGLPIIFVTEDKSEPVENFSTVSFHFPLAKGGGVGGLRLYGQDSKERKTIIIKVSDHQIVFHHVDDEVGKGKQINRLSSGHVIFSEVKKVGKTTTLYLSSFMDIHNNTSLDFQLSFRINNHTSLLGIKEGHNSFSQYSQKLSSEFTSLPFGVNSSVLHEAYTTSATNRTWVIISPSKYSNLVGELELPPFAAFRQMASGKKPAKTIEVFCKPDGGKTGENLVISLVCKVTLVGNHPYVDLYLRPRLVIKNNLFVRAIATTPMSGTFSKSCRRNKEKGTDTHTLSPFDVIEIFHGGPSVAFAYKCADNPIGGNRTGWNKLGWIDIPIKLGSRLEGPIHSTFPFLNTLGKVSKYAGGLGFFLQEEEEDMDGTNTLKIEDVRVRPARTISISIRNLGVDHTGDILFESWDMNQQFAARNVSERRELQNFTFSAFSSSLHKRRITILPKEDSLLRIMHLSMESADQFQRSEPFCVDDIAFCDGGIESTPIYWEDAGQSGYYVYRKLSSYNQSEVHVIPEFVLYNGGNSQVRVTVQRLSDILVDEGKMAVVKRPGENNPLLLSVMFDDHNCASAPIQVDEIGLKVVLIRSCKSGSPVGSLPIQTVLGSKDSRFVIKLGCLKHGNIFEDSKGRSLIHKDYLHYRIRWSQLEVTFLDTSKKNDAPIKESNSKSLVPQSSDSYRRVAHFVLDRFTLDYQKMFKVDAKADATRSQFSAIIHNIYVADCTVSPEKAFIASISEDCNFLDFRIRTRGSGDAGLAKVDLLELKLSHGEKKADPILINTSEEFLWNLLDIASRTNTAISQFTFTDTVVNWNEELQSFEIQAVDMSRDNDDDMDEDGKYRAPRSDMLFAVKKMFVWPSAFIVSFKRNPQAARYEQVRNVKSAKLVAYFMKKLNFTVDRARLRFAGFSCNNIKGPPDRILGSVKAFYIAQMKKKLFALLTATSIDEWRQLAGRDDGRDSYVEGDILRTTGNLAGKSAGFIVKKVGQGLGLGVAAGTAELGNGIQSFSEAIGVAPIGAGVNSLVSGIGEGVGNTVAGVGSGGNKIIKGAGKGVGQIIGGVGGGLQQVAVGIGKGVMTGDGSKVVNGIGDGAMSIGTGVLKGTESVVSGAAEGVFSVGKGLFSGVASLGKGVGNALQGKKPDRKRKPPRRR